jgi:glycosyltransferase involved in cell wall biosynthesis
MNPFKLEDRKIRVVSVIDRLVVGGPTKHIVWVIAGLDPRQFDATMITGTPADAEGDMSYYAHRAGIRPIVLKQMSREPNLRDIIVIAKLLGLFWKIKPDIIDTQKSKAGAVGRVAAYFYKWLTPSAILLRPRQCYVVHTYHGHVFHSYYGKAKTRLILAIERALARVCTDRIITISNQQRREISERFNVGLPEQFRVIPLGIDCEEAEVCESRFREEYGIGADEFVIGIVGRLCDVKNHEMFLESAARLIRRKNAGRPRLRFAVIGDGHLRERLERRAKKLGLADEVVFTGFRTDVASLYKELDLLVLTSLNEGTPLTLIEAMCAGRAVISTEVGGVTDIMGEWRQKHGELSVWDHGLTVPSRNVGALVSAIEYLIERPELRFEMGKRGRIFVRQCLSRDRLILEIESLYRELIGVEGVSPRAAQLPIS